MTRASQLVLMIGLSVPLLNTAQAQAPGEGACHALTKQGGASLGDPSLVITEAKPVAAGPAPADGRPNGPPAPPLPAHCELFGKLQERAGANGQTYAIRFHMRLPAAWNGRFFFGGGGGSNGVVGTATGNLLGAQSQSALGLGYAVVTQDSGHDNNINNDPARQGAATFGWDAEARRNYGFASIGKVTAVAKAIIRAFYGRPPARSYFVGGSKGGQEAFMAAQRFGREFDGILAGYPGFRLATAATAGEMWDNQAFARASRAAGALGSDGLPLLNRSFTDADLALVASSVLQACDALDGLKDGMAFAFTQCTTARVRPLLARATCPGPKTTTCLLSAQVEAMLSVIGGALGPGARPLYSSWAWDAGLGGRSGDGWFRGWRDWKMGRYESSTNEARNITLAVGTISSVFTSPPTPVAADPTSYTRYALDHDVAAVEAASRVKWGPWRESAVDFMNADSTDLSGFVGHGGKLLVFHGVSDPVFSIMDTIAWLDRVERKARGRADRFVRLYAVPGMNHGGGGPATDQADFFAALVAWVEQGTAPTTIIATARQGTAWPGRTRPLCPFPRYAYYLRGDPELSASFTCR